MTINSVYSNRLSAWPQVRDARDRFKRSTLLALIREASHPTYLSDASYRPYPQKGAPRDFPDTRPFSPPVFIRESREKGLANAGLA